jgi:hypothetical protein
LEAQAVHPLLPLLRERRKQLVLGLGLEVALDRLGVDAAGQLGKVLRITAANPKDNLGLHVGRLN